MRYCPVLIIAFLLFGLAGMPVRAEEGADDAVGVDELVKNPDTFFGEMRVAGVVSQVSPERSMFALIDLEEFRKCRKVTCSLLVLPVSWSGPMPEIRAQVMVTGQVGEVDGRKVFLADKLEALTDADP